MQGGNEQNRSTIDTEGPGSPPGPTFGHLCDLFCGINANWGTSVRTSLRVRSRRLIDSCEGCNPEGAEIPFDWLLDRVTGSDPAVADYILGSPAKCPNCRREVLEKTLVEPA
jgi:hypothetical protein